MAFLVPAVAVHALLALEVADSFAGCWPESFQHGSSALTLVAFLDDPDAYLDAYMEADLLWKSSAVF